MPPSTTGLHLNMHVHHPLFQLTGKRQERLGIDHRINSGFVDLARTGAFLNLDQLGAAVGKHLETDLHRFAAWRTPDSTDLAGPTPADEMTHMLPVRLPLPWRGKRHQIFLS